MQGMLLNVVHGQVQNSETKTYKKWFRSHSTLINYVQTKNNLIMIKERTLNKIAFHHVS